MKTLTTTLLSIMLMTSTSSAMAWGDYKTVNCKPIKYTFFRPSDDYYMVDFLCKENLVVLFDSPTGTDSPYMSLNWVNKTKYSEDLIRNDIQSQKYHQIVIDGAYFREVQTLDGIDVTT